MFRLHSRLPLSNSFCRMVGVEARFQRYKKMGVSGILGGEIALSTYGPREQKGWLVKLSILWTQGPERMVCEEDGGLWRERLWKCGRDWLIHTKISQEDG